MAVKIHGALIATPTSGAGSGNVVGPAVSVDDNIATFDGITGKLLQDGGTSLAAISTAIAAKVASNVAIAPATQTKITYDAKGLVLSGAQASLTDIASPTADFSMGTHKLTSVTDPAAAQDAATKAYVDAQPGVATWGVLVTGVGTQALTSSTTADQDFTTIYSFAANAIKAGKVFRLTLALQLNTAAGATTSTYYLKLGATKVCTFSALDPTTGFRNQAVQFLILGRAAPGAAVAVSSMPIVGLASQVNSNLTSQPVNLATDGALAVVFGVAFSSTGTAESLELQGWLLESIG